LRQNRASCAARSAARPQGPSYRFGPRLHPAQTCPHAYPDRSHPARGYLRHESPRHARLAGPGDPADRFCRWLHFARIDFGPIFTAVSRNGLKATLDRLSDKHIARLIKQTVRDAGLRPELPEAERIRLYSGHSLRAGRASSAEVDERYVQKQLGHASAEMTSRYQRRRDRFRIILTKAAWLYTPCPTAEPCVYN
jgi:integrase